MSDIDGNKTKSILPFLFGWLLLFFCFLSLYLATAQRGVGWQDSGEFQGTSLISSKEFVEKHAANGNLALAHPAYIAVARTTVSLFRNAPALAVNAISSICMAAAVANVWLLCMLTLARRQKIAAAIAATLFGLSHMTWWMATIAEVYAASAMMLSAELLFFSCALRDWDDKKLSAYGLSAIPSLLLLSLFAADGMARIKFTAGASVLILTAVASIPPLAYIAVNATLHRIRPAMLLKHIPAPFQDEIRYRTLPWKHNENSAERFAEEFATRTESNAIMIADITAANALKAYFRITPTLLGHRKIFSKLNDHGHRISFKAFLEGYRDRPWYVARPFPGYVPDNGFLSYDYERCGSFYRMKRKD